MLSNVTRNTFNLINCKHLTSFSQYIWLRTLIHLWILLWSCFYHREYLNDESRILIHLQSAAILRNRKSNENNFVFFSVNFNLKWKLDKRKQRWRMAIAYDTTNSHFKLFFDTNFMAMNRKLNLKWKFSIMKKVCKAPKTIWTQHF